MSAGGQWIIPVESEDQWLALRDQHIGASEVGALMMDDHPFTTPHAIWAVKRGIMSGKLDHPWLEHGLDQEPIVAKWLDRTYGLGIKKSDEYHIHPKFPWLACSLDYYALNTVNGPRLLEIKHASQFAPGWTRDRAPAYIEIQVQAQLMVVNAARVAMGFTPFEGALIGSMHGGNVEDLRLMERPNMPGVQKEIAEKSREFWERCVLRGEEPKAVSAVDCDHLRRLFLDAPTEGEVIELSDEEVGEAIKAWRQHGALKKYHEDKERKARAELMMACLVIDEKDVTSYCIGRTPSDEIIMKKGSQFRDGRTIPTLRFDVKKRRAS